MATATDTISIDTAGEIDANWFNNGMEPGGLRLVHTKRDTLLTVPSLNGSAPTYQYRSHNPVTGEACSAYYHVNGPALADWQRQQENKRIDLDNERRYRQLAQETADGAQLYIEPFKGWALKDAELFNERADFYAQRAAR